MLQALKLNIPLKDEEFDRIYPLEIRKLSPRHFTPFIVSKKIAGWLNEVDHPLNIVDLGCGVGKFCFVTGSLTKHKITGIDYRSNYIEICNRINSKYRFSNLKFSCQNILDLNFEDYNAFYFFNSFLEQVDDTAVLDNNYERSPEIFSIYQKHLRNQLALMPKGTIIITYHVFFSQVPPNYELIKSDFEDVLQMWIRK